MKTVVRIFHILLEVILSIVVFSLPWVVGQVFRSRSISFTYLCGQLLLWAVFQLIAVPMVFFKAEFSTLFWTYTGIAVLLAAVGAYTMLRARGRSKKRRTAGKAWWKRLSPFLAVALLIIGYQMFVYIFGMHLDEDDARWIAEANDALVRNKMLLHNPATGEYLGQFAGETAKDVFSPWSMYLAVLSRWTGIKAVIVAHTVYPPILLGLSYSAYYEIGSQLFGEKKKVHERGIFLLMVSVINLFMAGNVYTQSVFTLTRIWQGKAVVAAVMIPTILMVMLKIQTDKDMLNWLLMIIAQTACCLFSGMGIAIGLIMSVVYGLYVTVHSIVLNRRIGLTRVPMWLLSMIPSVLFGMGYLNL